MADPLFAATIGPKGQRLTQRVTCATCATYATHLRHTPDEPHTANAKIFPHPKPVASSISRRHFWQHTLHLRCTVHRICICTGAATMAASAKSRAALFQLSQIRTLPIRCELHQDQVLEASGQPRFSASIAFGSQHAHSGAAWFESGPQAEEASGHGSKRGTPRSDANQLIPPFASARQAAAGALLAQLHTMPRAAIHENADTALRTAMQLRHYEAVRAALGLEVVAPPVRAVLAQPPTPSSPRPSSCPSATLPSPPLPFSPPLLSSPSLPPFSPPLLSSPSL